MDEHEDDHDEYSEAAFTARERRRIRKLVRDDDNATYMQRTVFKWLAITGAIAATVVAMSDKIKTWLKWAFS